MKYSQSPFPLLNMELCSSESKQENKTCKRLPKRTKSREFAVMRSKRGKTTTRTTTTWKRVAIREKYL